MSASKYRYTCAQPGLCQDRNPACSAKCKPQRPISDEARDVPLVSPELVYLFGAILLVIGIAIGTALGSWLLHTWDAEIRQALAWVWQAVQRAYWAWANINF